MSTSNGLTEEVLQILRTANRFMSSREIFDKSKIADQVTEIAVCLINLQEGKATRIQRINAPPGGRMQYLYAAVGVAVPTATSATADRSRPVRAEPAAKKAETVDADPTPALRIPVKPITEAQKKFRVGRFSDGTMLIENLPGGGNLELDKESADQLLQLVRG